MALAARLQLPRRQPQAFGDFAMQPRLWGVAATIGSEASGFGPEQTCSWRGALRGLRCFDPPQPCGLGYGSLAYQSSGFVSAASMTWG